MSQPSFSRRFVPLLSAALALLLCARPALAQDSSVDNRLDQLQKELNALRSENSSMKSEINELRAQTSDKWLTEQRAEEIRTVVNDVLADADSRASLLDSGVMAGWIDHFFLASADGRFKLILEGEEQIRFVYNYHDQVDRHRWGFENTRTRLTYRGFIYTPDLTYLIRQDFARSGGGDTLLDAWIRYHFTDNWHFRFGQFKLPFNREELVSSSEQLAVERSTVNELLNIGRSQGIELEYTGDYDRVAVAYSDGVSATLAGVLGGAHTNTTALTEDTEWSFAGRYERLLAGNWDQFSDFTSPQGDEFGVLLGIGAYGQQSEANGAFSFTGRNEIYGYGYTVDASFEFGGASLFFAWFHHYVDTPTLVLNWYGTVAQASIYVQPKLELFIRHEYSWVDLHIDQGVSEINLTTAGFNYYFEGHDVKLTCDIAVQAYQLDSVFISDLTGFRADGDGVFPQIVFRTQLQLLF